MKLWIGVLMCGSMIIGSACSGSSSKDAAASAPAADGKCIAMCKTFRDACASALAGNSDPAIAEAATEACAEEFHKCNADPSEACAPVRDGCAGGVQASVDAGTIAAGSEEETAAKAGCAESYTACLTDPCV